MNYNEIELKHKILISKAKEYMNTINDKEHDINHMNDVVKYTKEILDNLDNTINIDACLIGAYFHDVGRTKIKNKHEELSSKMLILEMSTLNYSKEFIEICSNAIKFHKWNMNPQTIEGHIIKDADKLAWLGSGRWITCIDNNCKLDAIIKLLPKLRNDILYFECSKKIYDIQIVKIITLLYNKLYLK